MENEGINLKKKVKRIFKARIYKRIHMKGLIPI